MYSEVRLYSFGLVLCSILSLITAYYLLRKKDTPGVPYFATLALISIIWYTGYIIELNANTLSQKLFAIKIEYLAGIPFTPVLCYFATRHFTSNKKHPGTLEIILFSIIPLATMIMVQTNDFHHLFYKSIGARFHQSYLFFTKTPGLWYYVHIFYSYSLIILSVFFLFRNFLRSNGIIKRQSLYFLLIIILPFTASLSFINKFFSGYLFDVTPFCYSLAVVFIGYSLQKHGMPELLPEARKIIMSSISTGIIVLDSNDRIIEVNPYAKEIFSNLYQLGMSFSGLLKKAGINASFSSLQDGKIHDISFNNNYFEVSIFELPGKEYSGSGKIAAFYNVTERKNYEHKLRELNSSKDKLFSVIAHDLKNPMYGMMGISELLFEDFDRLRDNEKIGFIKDINELSFNTHKMLESLLDWSRQQTGRINFSPEIFNLCSVLRLNILSAEKQAGLKKIHVCSHIANDIKVFADKNMINTVIRNLLSNAIKFTGTGGEITLTARTNNNMAEVSVSDNGVGMSEENCKKLFRIDGNYKSPGTAGEKGTGLGLLLCKEFIEKNNGNIFVSSQQGHGSIFTFSVPLSN